MHMRFEAVKRVDASAVRDGYMIGKMYNIILLLSFFFFVTIAAERPADGCAIQ